MEDLVLQRKKYNALRIPTFPVRGKVALKGSSWKPYQDRLPTDEEIENDNYDSATGVAGAMGNVCGGMIIDCDIKDPKNTCDPKIIERLKVEGYPETLTGSLGSQFLVKFDPALGFTSNAKVLPGVDIKSHGGYVVLPPSEALYGQDELQYARFNGNKYEWVKEWNGEELKPFPAWLLEMINAKNPAAKNKEGKYEDAFDYSSAMSGIEDGSRNDLAVRVIGRYLAGAKTEENFRIAWETTKLWNLQNKPPMEESALKKTFNFYKKKEEAKNNKNTGEVFSRIGQAKAFIEKQPIFYSPEGLLWFWNFDRCCYELKDEIDLLNGIRKEMNVDTIGSRNRGEIIAALKQVGRELSPQDKPKGWVQFREVLINPKTLERTKADHNFFLTNPIPHNLGESEETPVIDKLLREWAIKEGIQDESYVQSLYEYIAYSLTDDLFLQRIIALTGGGSNGKGTFLKVIENLVGKDNCCSIDVKKLSTNNFAMASIFKKLVAFAGEVGYNDLSNTNVLKKITGEDLIEYEFKGKNSFTDTSITTFFIATNSLPTTPDKSTGFYRRWAITDFPNVFNIKADILSEITEKEYENLCLKCVNILKRLYEIQKFTNEGSYEEREKRFEERSNPLPAFIDDKCDEEAGEKIKLQDFGNKFNEWLKERRLRMMTIKQIGEQLRNAGWTIGNRLFLNEAGTTSKAVINLRWK